MSEIRICTIWKLKFEEKDLNRSCVIGLLGMIFSISIAIACASNMPMTMGSLLLPPTSPITKVKEPDWEWLDDKPKISSSIGWSTGVILLL